MPDQSFDIVVFGATSFVGQLIGRYLVETYGVDGELKWAAAGRNRQKLEGMKNELGDRASDLPLITADANQPDQLRELCGQTQLVLSTVGPYALYGEPMVKACAETGTDYVDLTGEVHWIRDMLRKYEGTARDNGARIVNCCGFDSIPSDLGVHFLQQQAKGRFGAPCNRIKMRVKAMKGTFSGGTVASMLNVAQEAAKDKEVREILADPYALCFAANASGNVKQPSVTAAEYDEDFDTWLAPFVMGMINTRVVHRSNCILNSAYGEDFQYDEAVITGKGMKGRLGAYGMAAGLGGFMVGVALKPTRWIMERFFLPAPGEGPSPEAQEKGFFDVRFHGKTKKGEEIRAKVTGDKDPGYGSTAKMISESAICLVQEVPKESKPGGFWTPATLFGDTLVERLQEKAGLTFEVLDSNA